MIEKTIKLIKTICNTKLAIQPNTPLIEIDNWDSLAMVRLFFILEQEFDIKFDLDDYEDVESPNDIVEKISKHC